MTIQGTANKTGLLLLLSAFSAACTWLYFAPTWTPAGLLVRSPDALQGLTLLGSIGGFVAAFVTINNKEKASYMAPVYAILKGLALGGASAIMEARFPGLVSQAVILTFSTLGTMLLAYKRGFIKVTDTFRAMVLSATGGVALAYLLAMFLGFFGVRIPLFYSSGFFSILFSLFVVGLAAFNLVLDFHEIHQGVQRGAPKAMEWYSAFALMLTIVWLYFEILSLLMKTQRRDD